MLRHRELKRNYVPHRPPRNSYVKALLFKYNCVWRWGLREVTGDKWRPRVEARPQRIGVLCEENHQRACSPPALLGHGTKAASCEPGTELSPTPNGLAPWPQTSQTPRLSGIWTPWSLGWQPRGLPQTTCLNTWLAFSSSKCSPWLLSITFFSEEITPSSPWLQWPLLCQSTSTKAWIPVFTVLAQWLAGFHLHEDEGFRKQAPLSPTLPHVLSEAEAWHMAGCTSKYCFSTILANERAEDAFSFPVTQWRTSIKWGQQQIFLM